MLLNIEPNMKDFDAFYEALIESHRELTTEQSHEMNAKLVLLLANHIGSIDILRDAMRRARVDTVGAGLTALESEN